MYITLPYGHEKIGFTVPEENFCEILSPKEVAPADDIEAEIEKAIDNPIGTGKLGEILKPGQTVNIICDDMSRPTPVFKILPVVTRKLLQAGIKKNDIKIVVALGSHRYMTKDEIISKVGQGIYDEYRVVNSEFRNGDDLADYGLAPDGTRVFVSRTAVDSDVRIGIGNIVPHPTMGWAGGGKILYPGVAGEKTVMQFHMLGGLADDNYFGMDDCPIRLNVEKWVDTIGLHFIINTILTSNFDIYKVVAGDYIKAHRKGVEYAKEVIGRKIKEKVEIMVVSSYPADQDFWQSGKGYYSAEHGLIEKGGTMILVSPNYEGMGPHPDYARFTGMDNAEEHLIRFREGRAEYDDPLGLSVGAAVSKMRKRRELIMVSDGLTKEEADVCKIKLYPRREIQKALDEAIAKYDNPGVSVITHGGELYIY